MNSNAFYSKENNKRIIFYLLISMVVFYFVFSPALNLLYYFSSDDTRYATGGLNAHCKADDGFYYMLTLGRPIQAYMDCFAFKVANTLENMRWLRIFSVCLMGCTVALFAEWLCRFGFSLIAALFAAGSLFMISNYYSDSVYTASISLPFSVLFALIAYFAINQYHSLHSRLDALNQSEQSRKNKSLIVSAGFILFSILTYPAMSFFFAVLILSKLLFSKFDDWRKTRTEIVREVVLFCAVATVYFVWAYINMHYFPKAPVPANYQLDHPNFSPIQMLSRLAILFNVFNHAVWENILHGWVMTLFLLTGAVTGLVYFIKERLRSHHQKNNFFILLQMIAAAIALMILSSSFILLIPNTDLGARLLLGTVAAGFVLFFWSVVRSSFLFPNKLRKTFIFLVLGTIFMIEGTQANLQVTQMTLGNLDYIYFLREKLSSYLADGKELKRVHFIIPADDYPYTKFYMTVQAIMPLMNRESYHLEWCSLARGIPGAEQDHQKEAMACINRQPKNGIAITYTLPGETYKKTEPMLIVDMANVSLPRYVQELKQKYWHRYTVRA